MAKGDGKGNLDTNMKSGSGMFGAFNKFQPNQGGTPYGPKMAPGMDNKNMMASGNMNNQMPQNNPHPYGGGMDMKTGQWVWNTAPVGITPNPNMPPGTPMNQQEIADMMKGQTTGGNSYGGILGGVPRDQMSSTMPQNPYGMNLESLLALLNNPNRMRPM